MHQLQQKVHGTILEVNLDALSNNLNFYKAKLKPQTKIMVMVKAFAYGSGSFEIANLLQFHVQIILLWHMQTKELHYVKMESAFLLW